MKRQPTEIQTLILCIVLLFMFIIGVSSVNAQQQPVFIECTAGDYPDEISWEIMDCDGDIITSGGSPYLGAAILPPHYIIFMEDSYGDGWNGAYLSINLVEYGFLSDVDWIDSIGTYPQNFTSQYVDVGCADLSVNDEIDNKPFLPTKYFDLLGREVKPTRGFYLATDGVLTRKVYINEVK
jgi:hypothetical protein|tara:strand:- start:5348 stop:5890 length:543 start_codon:yes stop_codon:yes gene_type:complete